MTTIKKVYTGDEARMGLLKGMEVVAKTVGATAGAAGRNACIANQWGYPSMTKDGYKTSKSIELAGIEGEGVKLIQQAAEKQNQEAGDATTLVTTLTYEIVKEGLKYMEKGCNATLLKKGIDAAANKVVDVLKSMSKTITSNEEVGQIATISANGDEEIGNLIANAVEKVGKTGVITSEPAKDFNTTLEFTEGWEISDEGFVSPYFMTDPEKQIVEFDKPFLFLTDAKINSLKQIVSLLEEISKTGRPIVFICEDIEQDALGALIMNHLKGQLKSCVVKAPEFGDFRKMVMEDLAILTNAQYISEKLGMKLDNVKLSQLGSCQKIKIYPNKTVIIGGSGNKESLDARIKEIQAEINNAEGQYDTAKLEERLAKLTGGIALIKVGGKSETEMNEKKDRVEDAICSTKAALEEGILPGGGTALVWASQLSADSDNVDVKKGYEIVFNAIKRQAINLANNAGVSGEVVLNNIIDKGVANQNIGYNLVTGEYVDMFEEGIVDATKCIRLAVETASSVAGGVLTTETVVVPDIDEAIKMAKLVNTPTM